MILRIIKDKICFIHRRLRWITQTEALIILDIMHAKTKFNNSLLYWVSQKSLPFQIQIGITYCRKCVKTQGFLLVGRNNLTEEIR